MTEAITAEVEAAYERLLESLAGADVPQVYPVLRSLASLYGFRSEHAKAVARRIPVHAPNSEQRGWVRRAGAGQELLHIAHPVVIPVLVIAGADGEIVETVTVEIGAIDR